MLQSKVLPNSSCKLVSAQRFVLTRWVTWHQLMWHPSSSHGVRSMWMHVRWATCPAVLEGKSLTQIQRRITALKRLQSSLLWPPLSEFEAFGRNYPLPLRACQPQMAKVPVERLQYLAGFLDGDGCVSSNQMKPVISVGQCARSADVLVLFRDAFGGGVYTSRPGKGLVRPSLYWRLAASGACSLAAKSLVDYAVVKHAHLKLIVNWPSEPQQRNLVVEVLSGLNDSSAPDIADESVNLSWGWLAGFVDAEGWIGFRADRHDCTFTISQKRKLVLEKIGTFLKANGIESANIYPSGQDGYCLKVATQGELMALLDRLLQNGLLLKRNQAETALKVGDLNHTELRYRMATHAGNQKRYSRLDSDGCQRAREIALLGGRLRSSSKVDLSQLKKLQVLREEHEFQNSITVYSTLRSDTKLLISQGAQKQHLVGEQTWMVGIGRDPGIFWLKFVPHVSMHAHAT